MHKLSNLEATQKRKKKEELNWDHDPSPNRTGFLL
jgi:hypothetical protein